MTDKNIKKSTKKKIIGKLVIKKEKRKPTAADKYKKKKSTKKKTTKKKAVTKNKNNKNSVVISTPPFRRVGRPPAHDVTGEIYKHWPDWAEQYLELYATHYTKSIACAELPIHADTLRRYMRGCREFRTACEDVRDSITDKIEKSATHRAIHGTDELYLWEGEPVFTEDPKTGEKCFLTKKKWETQLTTFMLRGRRRETYYPENQGTGGTTDDKATAVREVLAEITKVMAPPPDWDEEIE